MQSIVTKALDKLQKKNPTAYNEFHRAFETGSAKKGDTLIEVGSICKKLYFLERGIAKQYRYKDDGSEHITWFSFKEDLVTAYTSFVLQNRSLEGVEVIEDCEFICISREICYELAEKYHAMDTFFRELLELYYIQSDERLFFLQALTARQKYDYIFKHKPHFIQELPQKELASFLGITRETLSRIRKFS